MAVRGPGKRGRPPAAEMVPQPEGLVAGDVAYIEREKESVPVKWTPRHDIVVALYLGGLKNWEIAAQVGFSEGKVSAILNDPRAAIVKDRLGSQAFEQSVEVQDRIFGYAHEALDEVVEQMRMSNDERVRQKAAFSILDRAGYSKIERRAAATAPVSDDVARRMLKALDEIKGSAEKYDYSTALVGPIVDAEVEILPEAGDGTADAA